SWRVASLRPASAAVHPPAARVERRLAGSSRRMPVIKKRLSTDMLPPDLSERQRFMFFAELFEHFSNTGELDPADDVPFRAAMTAINGGTAVLGGGEDPSHKRFTNVHLPMATLKSMVAEVDDLVGTELVPGGALSLAMDYSDLLLKHTDAVDEAGFAIAAHL